VKRKLDAYIYVLGDKKEPTEETPYIRQKDI